MRRLVLLLTALCFALPPTGAAGSGDSSRPSLQLESGHGSTRVWVEITGPDGLTRRSLVRETEGSVKARSAGGDPAGRAAFVTWDENGDRWFSYSRDAGATWAQSRQLKTELRLRDATVAPGDPMPAAEPGLALSQDGRLFVVQFRTVGLPEWRDTLSTHGAKVLSYLPHNAHLARIDEGQADTIRDLEFVERVEPYHPSYRLEPELRREALEGDAVTFGPERVRVMTFEWGPAGKQRVIEAARALGARVAKYWPSGHVVELWVDREQLLGLAAHDDVMWIDRWTPPGTDMDLVREDAGSNFVENNFGYCGQGVRGEVMDGGIQDDHPDFDGILLHGPHDLDSHGTATYGIVFGNGDRDGDGDGRAIGHLPCAQGIFAAYPEMTDRFVHTQELKQSPYFASFQSNSWGAAQTTAYTSDSFEMDDIIWRLDFAILNSQSNTGNQTSRPQAWAKNVISVGGIRHYDTLDTSDDAWLGGASIGPAQDGRIKPDVSYWYDDIFTTTTGSSYTPNFGGTSAATPESAGTLGLLLQLWAENVWETDPQGATVFEKQPHASTLKALLINNSQQYEFVGSGADLSRFKQGWGRPSARVAYERAATSLVVDEEVILELNDAVTYSVDVPAGQSELKVTMVYPDPPGTTSASLHRVNDVNVEVTSPSAAVYHGNAGLEDGTESTPGGSPDSLNTVENVFVRNPEAGNWSVRIEAVEINQDAYLGTPADDVTFALVVTGGSGVATSGAGSVRLSPSTIACEQTLEILVRDGNVGSPSLTVDVWSDTETTPETVTLQETNSGSGNYAGQISTTTGAPSQDGMLSVADGDTVTVEYLDADDGQGGSSVPRQDSASVDCAPPVISNVWAANVTDTSAAITWLTDKPSDSRVNWGPSIPPAQPEARAGNMTSHTVVINGLSDCTTYYYSVASEDAVGNSTEDDNAGAFYLFTTQTRTDGQLHSCRDGTLVLEAEAVSCMGNVPVRLTDTDRNLDPNTAETAEVMLTSSTETIPEPLIVTETAPDSGVFTGSLPTGAGPAVSGDGILQASHDDLVTGRYDDPDDGTGTPTTSIYSIVADCAGAGISNVEVRNITDANAEVYWTTTEGTTGYVDWGPTPALGNQASSGNLNVSHGAGIGAFPECDRVYFRVVTTDAYGNESVADVAGAPFELNALGVPGVYYVDDFETDTGWTLAGEWERGAPQGLGSSPGDPSAAFGGSSVLGHDLSGLGTELGDFEPLSNEPAISSVIDASGMANVELRFRRWLNITNGSFAYIDVRDSGGSWRTVWQSTVAGVGDSAWATIAFNIATYADGNPDLQVRFRERSFLGASFAAGWNIDELTLRDGSLPDLAVCGGCDGAPTFAGLVLATDDDPCADSGVTLAWSAAPAWGTGTQGTYAIYRDTVPGFTPGSQNLLASGVVPTTWTDAAAPADVDLYYLVRAENDETCSTGPANAGVVDGNLVHVLARNDTAQAPPDSVGNTLLVNGINKAHARLNWSAASGAATYHVLRSPLPDGTFDLHGGVGTTQFEDADVFADGQSWYYLVRAVDACGNEGP